MTLADVLAVVAGLAIVGSGFASTSVVLSLLFPRAVGRACGRLEERLGRSLLLGLLLLMTLVLGIGRLLQAAPAPAHLAAIAALLGGFSLAVVGGAGLAASVGRRSRVGAEGPVGVRDLLRGAILLEGAVLLPLVGWFVVLPVALLASLGAGFLTVFRRGSPRAPALDAARS